MRLWHEALLPYLPRLQFNGQHRECCALRGKGWGKKHETVDYVFTHSFGMLYEYHRRYLILREIRYYDFDINWLDSSYRGKQCEPTISIRGLTEANKKLPIVYEEHNEEYLKECIRNIAEKIELEPDKYTYEDITRFLSFPGIDKYF